MRFRFVDYELDAQRFILRRAGERLPLRPKVFDLLIYLIRNRSRVVLREELFEVLWGDTVVGQGSLSGLVNELRNGLGERAGAGSSIRTVHARGYQFVADVRGEEPADGAEPRKPLFEARVRFPSHTSALLEDLHRRLSRVIREGASGVLIEGPRQSGKSALLDALIPVAVHDGFEVQRLSFSAPGPPVADALLERLLDSLVESRDLETVRESLPARSRDLLDRSLFAEGFRARSVAGGIEARQREDRARRALALLIRRLSQTAPMLLTIDDLDRAEARAGELLVTLLSLLGDARVLIIATLRTYPEREVGQGGDRAIALFRRHHRVETLRLTRLGREGLRTIFEAEGVAPLPDPLVDELLRHLAEPGSGVDRVARWLGAEGQAMALTRPGRRMRLTRSNSGPRTAGEGSR
ncbi:MAG: winged helix-turn-helix domain-containing protein [Myxococcota bacterium]